eukprot:scaffold25496_cov130-Isochrysis_galbana.AAC.9
MEELMRKHAELQRMRSTIFGSGLLDSEQGGASAPRFAPKRAWEEEQEEEEEEQEEKEEEQEEEEEEEEDEPTTEEGWVRKLMQQQEQLNQLRAGISAVQNQVEEEEEDEVRNGPREDPLSRVCGGGVGDGSRVRAKVPTVCCLPHPLRCRLPHPLRCHTLKLSSAVAQPMLPARRPPYSGRGGGGSGARDARDAPAQARRAERASRGQGEARAAAGRRAGVLR